MIDLEQNIRERAYQIWEQEGCVHGRDKEHWHAAKLELTSAVEEQAVAIEAPAVAAEPAKKKGRRSSKEAVPAVPTAPVVAAAAPRRRRATPTLQ
ncbi:MAG TPA: DUF2934 domain-containing protein [Microvirga sp.]|nr:DUF2934 domain-containing protein [Microvirga sp.]